MTKTLTLTPTGSERDGLARAGLAGVEVIGFGPVGAAIGATRLVAAARPDLVLLIGLAGSFDTREFALGEARLFGRVRFDGVGVGRLATPLDHEILPGLPEPNRGWPLVGDGPELLTVCQILVDEVEIAARRANHPDALAEDMESWAVAAACHALGVPLAVIRGASNVVGDRHHETWRSADALFAVAALAGEFLESQP